MRRRDTERHMTGLLGVGILCGDDVSLSSTAHKQKFIEIIKNFRAEDQQDFEKIKEINYADFKEIYTDLRLRTQGLPELLLVVYLNCCSFKQIREEFYRFLLRFDDNHDGYIQQEEFEDLLEALAKPDQVGRERVKIGLIAIGIGFGIGKNILMEGTDGDRLVDKEVSAQLTELLIANNSQGKTVKKGERLNYIKLWDFMPYILAYWIESELNKVLKNRYDFEQVMGVPIVIRNDGTSDINPMGPPSGLYLAISRAMDRHVNLQEECINFRVVVKALMTYRLPGSKDSLNHSTIDKIIKKVRVLMNVDKISGIEEKLFTLTDLLPELALWVCQESGICELRDKLGSKFSKSAMMFENLRQEMHRFWKKMEPQALSEDIVDQLGDRVKLKKDNLEALLFNIFEAKLPPIKTNLIEGISKLLTAKSQNTTFSPRGEVSSGDLLRPGVVMMKALEHTEELLGPLFSYLLDPTASAPPSARKSVSADPVEAETPDIPQETERTLFKTKLPRYQLGLIKALGVQKHISENKIELGKFNLAEVQAKLQKQAESIEAKLARKSQGKAKNSFDGPAPVVSESILNTEYISQLFTVSDSNDDHSTNQVKKRLEQMRKSMSFDDYNRQLRLADFRSSFHARKPLKQCRITPSKLTFRPTPALYVKEVPMPLPEAAEPTEPVKERYQYCEACSTF